MERDLLNLTSRFILAGFLLLGVALGSRAEAASVPPADRSAIIESGAAAALTPVRWVCGGPPGSGMGRRCQWVQDPGWRWRQYPRRCWTERGIPGSGIGPQRVCR